MTVRWFKRALLLLILAILGSQMAMASSSITMAQKANFDLFKAVISHERISSEHKIEAINAALQAGAQLHAVDASGLNALHHACMLKDKIVISYLVFRGADVTAKDPKGNTALHFLLRNCACDLVDPRGNLISSKYEHKENAYIAAKILIQCGSDFFAKNQVGELAAEFIRDEFIENELSSLAASIPH